MEVREQVGLLGMGVESKDVLIFCRWLGFLSLRCKVEKIMGG